MFAAAATKIVSIEIDPKKFLLNCLRRCRTALADFSPATDVVASPGLPPKGGSKLRLSEQRSEE
jgi:hypothetical protein